MFAALVLVGVLADASACILASTRIDGSAGQISISALCPCGCNAHTGALAGIGISQLAALPAEVVPPAGPRVAPGPADPQRPSVAPIRAIDHVPILLA
jgi:hypothetical protein